MGVTGFDHVAMPTSNPEAAIAFYSALGFNCPCIEEYRNRRIAFFSIRFGDNKINVHAPKLWENSAFTLRGPTARPGCGDFCFVWQGGLEDLQATREAAAAVVVEGPVEREGGRATGTSVYTRGS